LSGLSPLSSRTLRRCSRTLSPLILSLAWSFLQTQQTHDRHRQNFSLSFRAYHQTEVPALGSLPTFGKDDTTGAICTISIVRLWSRSWRNHRRRRNLSTRGGEY